MFTIVPSAKFGKCVYGCVPRATLLVTTTKGRLLGVILPVATYEHYQFTGEVFGGRL